MTFILLITYLFIQMQPAPRLNLDNTAKAFSHLSDYELYKRRVIFSFINQKILTKIGRFFIIFLVKCYFPVKLLLRNNIYTIFCGGENLEEVDGKINELQNSGVGVILDYGLERSVNEEEYTNAYQKILETIHFLGEKEGNGIADFKVSSLISIEILEKFQLGKPFSSAESDLWNLLVKRLDDLAFISRELNVSLMVDAEESWVQGAIDNLVLELMIKVNREKCIIYNTFQMYRTDGYDLLENAVKMSYEAGFYLGVKLVRGAYLEKENLRAAERKYSSPVFSHKSLSDDAFNRALKMLCSQDKVYVCCATHNEESTKLFFQEIRDKNRNEQYFFAQLLGMSDNITYNLSGAGVKTYKYVPFGPVNKVIPYLLRRSEENTSVEGQTSRELNYILKECRRRKGLKNRRMY